MDYGALWTTIGLIFDIVGVFGLFQYGIPPIPGRQGNIVTVTGQIDEEEKNQAARYDAYSWISLGLIQVGFIIQAFAVWI